MKPHCFCGSVVEFVPDPFGYENARCKASGLPPIVCDLPRPPRQITLESAVEPTKENAA